jgi:hypothetical protein
MAPSEGVASSEEVAPSEGIAPPVRFERNSMVFSFQNKVMVGGGGRVSRVWGDYAVGDYHLRVAPFG